MVSELVCPLVSGQHHGFSKHSTGDSTVQYFEFQLIQGEALGPALSPNRKRLLFFHLDQGVDHCSTQQRGRGGSKGGGVVPEALRTSFLSDPPAPYYHPEILHLYQSTIDDFIKSKLVDKMKSDDETIRLVWQKNTFVTIHTSIHGCSFPYHGIILYLFRLFNRYSLEETLVNCLILCNL